MKTVLKWSGLLLSLALLLSLVLPPLSTHDSSAQTGPALDYVEIVRSLEQFIKHEMVDKDLPAVSIALVDEAYLPYHSRRSMAEESTAMSQVLNLSRQRNQTLIFVTQEARQVDRNIASSATVIAFKEMGMLQPEFDRPELRKLGCQDGIEGVAFG